jgi:hypothetical protein
MSVLLYVMYTVLAIVVICFGVAGTYTFLGIGQIDDASTFMQIGYPLTAGIFALGAAVAIPFSFPETDLTLSIAVLIGVTALALSIGALATGSITH